MSSDTTKWIVGAVITVVLTVVGTGVALGSLMVSLIGNVQTAVNGRIDDLQDLVNDRVGDLQDVVDSRIGDVQTAIGELRTDVRAYDNRLRNVEIGWVRLFFVDGPRGFCQRHGKSYLTRRRRGGEGGGGGLLTGRAISSAYRWAWCRWYSRVVEVPVRIEVAAGFVAPGASEPPRLQPSWPPGGFGPAHG